VVPVLPGDSVESLRARIQLEERRILPVAIEMLTRNLAARSSLG